MALEFLPSPNQFAGQTVAEWFLVREVGRGKNGVVYHARRTLSASVVRDQAIKIIPNGNLKDSWITEFEKASVLSNLPEIVQYYNHSAQILDSKTYVCVWWEYVDGPNLKSYCAKNPNSVTLSFVDSLIRTCLRAFVAMSTTGIYHGDLHAGNILVTSDRRRPGIGPVIKISDFGIGGSHNSLRPKDDYIELAKICHWLLTDFIDPAALGDSHSRRFFKYLVDDFIPRSLLEENRSASDSVREPVGLLASYEKAIAELDAADFYRGESQLQNPFDYLSCEQIGDSFELLQTLYSSRFPGYDDLLQPANTILTGPRGCGKSTVFRNLSLKTELLGRGKSIEGISPFIGIYYHCGDLFFPFHHVRERISPTDRTLLVHYFNLALMREIIETCAVCDEKWQRCFNAEQLGTIERFVSDWLQSYATVPFGTSVLRHILAVVDSEKERLGTLLKKRKRVVFTGGMLPIDFIPQLVAVLQESVPWLANRPFYVFLDDYSLPHISRAMQVVLHDVIFYRRAHCCFKVATESFASFHPVDSTGKLIEETREYDVVDLGSYFMQMEGLRKQFLTEIVDNRLQNARVMHPDYARIAEVLGPNSYASYNALARQIREGKQVLYAGLETVTDLFSGDIADVLRLIRGIFSTVGPYELFSRPGLSIPIAAKSQDRAIRDYGAAFLERVRAAPGSGQRLRKIAEEVGRGANWLVKNVISPNETGSPPKQAFRLEILDSLSFADLDAIRPAYEKLLVPEKRKLISVEQFADSVRLVYNDLLKYGVFLRDVRGKSARGAVVPRLYLRRLLIPTFVLTPSQRDNISLSATEFVGLLYAPESFGPILREREKKRERRRDGGKSQMDLL